MKFALVVLGFVMAACTQSEAVATNESVDATENSEAQASGWTVDYDNSQLGFSAAQNGKKFDGVFEEFEARILLDPENPETGLIDVLIDMKSARIADRQKNAALPGTDWFNVKQYPVARFQASEIAAKGDGLYEAVGALTIRDVTKEVTLPFKLDVNDDEAQAVGAITLLRTDFDVGRGEFSEGKWVSLEVIVTVDIAASRRGE